MMIMVIDLLLCRQKFNQLYSPVLLAVVNVLVLDFPGCATLYPISRPRYSQLSQHYGGEIAQAFEV
jgi:hypothetical protein